MNIDLSEYLLPEKKEICKPFISLCGMLEVVIGNYYVYGGDGEYEDYWLTIYYDPDMDTLIEAGAGVPRNVVAYISSDYRWAFVLSKYIHMFRQDVSSYDVFCIPVPDFECERLQCSHPDLLPCEFSDILWIDDDFMNDESIPFDFDSFALIDDGVRYLNPKYFSVTQLIKIMEKTSR